jgi:catechol 2,3-dioxygenase-like lactoylglutathione lyase family enzyme
MRIRSVTLATRDLDAQAAFWERRLGVPGRRPSSDALELPMRSSLVRFEQRDDVEDPRYHLAINIPPGTIAEAAAWVAERQEILAFHGDPDVEEGATIVSTDLGVSSLYFLDGGGNVVELIANDHINRRTDGDFGPTSLLEIAEIGIATADVPGTGAAVQTTFGADVAWGGRPGWQLTAVGDDHGVVIVSPIGRGWIPVGLPARPLPTTIVAEASRDDELILDEGPYRLCARANGSW